MTERAQMSDIDEQHEAALKTVARAVAARLLAAVGDGWEDYADLGEHDWGRVCEIVCDMMPLCGPVSEFQAAYQRLAAKSTDWKE